MTKFKRARIAATVPVVDSDHVVYLSDLLAKMRKAINAGNDDLADDIAYGPIKRFLDVHFPGSYDALMALSPKSRLMSFSPAVFTRCELRVSEISGTLTSTYGTWTGFGWVATTAIEMLD